jgi:hypothetical protein
MNSSNLLCQTETDKKNLEKEIIKMDSLLFKEAFNKCNLEIFENIISDDIEFYDDRSGLNTSKQKEINSFKDKCSKPFTIKRKLNSIFIDKLGDFGAIQTGIHTFLVDDKEVQKAKFVTIWEHKNGKWFVKRAISYEHKSIE